MNRRIKHLLVATGLFLGSLFGGLALAHGGPFTVPDQDPTDLSADISSSHAADTSEVDTSPGPSDVADDADEVEDSADDDADDADDADEVEDETDDADEVEDESGQSHDSTEPDHKGDSGSDSDSSGSDSHADNHD
ncbi:MAG TPA: hypothetical protein VI541_02445 [Actinomycetota bacterium]|nr:hypothetical protein [Actinomycetota bacterium]